MMEARQPRGDSGSPRVALPWRCSAWGSWSSRSRRGFARRQMRPLAACLITPRSATVASATRTPAPSRPSCRRLALLTPRCACPTRVCSSLAMAPPPPPSTHVTSLRSGHPTSRRALRARRRQTGRPASARPNCPRREGYQDREDCARYTLLVWRRSLLALSAKSTAPGSVAWANSRRCRTNSRLPVSRVATTRGGC